LEIEKSRYLKNYTTDRQTDRQLVQATKPVGTNTGFDCTASRLINDDELQGWPNVPRFQWRLDARESVDIEADAAVVVVVVVVVVMEME